MYSVNDIQYFIQQLIQDTREDFKYRDETSTFYKYHSRCWVDQGRETAESGQLVGAIALVWLTLKKKKNLSGGENKRDILIVDTGSRSMGLAFRVNLVYLDISNTTSKMFA